MQREKVWENHINLHPDLLAVEECLTIRTATVDMQSRVIFPCYKFLLSLLIKNFSIRKNYPTQIDFLLSSTLLQTLSPSQGLYNNLADPTNLKYLLWYYVLDSRETGYLPA
jgi:hypothetical protein